MPAPSANSQLDGISSVTLGMNGGVAPRLIPINQVAMAVNCTFRSGLPGTRPVLRKVALSYGDEALHANATAALFQCAAFYQAYGAGENCLVASIGGHLFRYLVGTTNVVQDVSVTRATALAVAFTAPAINSTVMMTVTSVAGVAAGMMLTVEGGNFQVVSVTGATTMLVRNLNLAAGTVIAIGPPAPVVTVFTDLNNPLNPDAWMWQSEDFLIVNNGAADPLFFDGAKARRSLGSVGGELPAGCMGVYVQGRNWMALPNAHQKPSQNFIGGDLVYSHGFMDGYGGRAAVLKTEENTFLSGGGAFSVPVEAGPITAMSSVAVADTTLGQGPLQVMTAASVFSVQVPFLREDWAVMTQPAMTVGLPGYGAISHLCVVRVNGDLWYRAHDGLRSYQVGRRDLGTWVHTPLSEEVENVLALDSAALLEKANGVLFDNRLLETCSPFQHDRGTAHRGAVALDFSGISTLTSRGVPAYDGLWTGISVLQWVKGVFNGVERCFAFAVDGCGRIALYELDKTDARWFDYNGSEDVPIESFFISRSMGWKDAGNILKRLRPMDIYLDRLAGDDKVEFELKYRSDEDPAWQDWHSFTLCAPVKDCATSACPEFDNVREQYRTYLRLPEPADVCSAITKRMTRTGYEFQILAKWTGFAQWNRIHVWADPIKDSVVTGCPTSETCTLVKGCDEPWFTYEMETGCDDPIPAGGVPATPPPRPGDPDTGSGEEEPDRPPPIPVGEPVLKDAPPTGTPVWPPPTPVGDPTLPPPIPVPEPDPEHYPCGETVSLSTTLAVVDSVSGVSRPVGVLPPAGVSPEDYLDPGVLEAWSAAVWAAWEAEKIAGGIVPANEYITWWYIHETGLHWNANHVYADPALPFWLGVADLDWKLVIAWC